MILVTGATGLLGNCIVRELLSRGEKVRVLCRTNTSLEAIEGLKVEIHRGDLSNDAILGQAVAGCSAVIHSAAMIHIGWQNLAASREVNVEGTRRLIRACQLHSAKLIHISTVDTLLSALDVSQPISETSPRPVDSKAAEAKYTWLAYGVPKVPCAYVVSKQEAEQEVRRACEQGLQAVIIHPGFMLGPYDWKPSSGRMMQQIRIAPLLVAPAGGCSVCDARDVAQATVNAVTMGQSGESYILAGENITYQHLWQAMLDVMEVRRRVLVGGRPIVWIGKLIDGANRWLGLRERDINGAIIAMGHLLHYYDSHRSERELNYHRRPLDETLRDAWQWLSERAGPH